MTRKAAIQEPTGTVLYRERTSKKEELRRRRAELTETIGMASSDVDRKRPQAEEAAREVSRFMKSTRERNERIGKHRDFMEPHELERLGKLNSEAAAADEAVTIAEQRKTEIGQEILKLDLELQNFESLLGVYDVLQYQEDVAKAEKKVAEFQTLIAEQDSTIEKAGQAVPGSIDDLLLKREDILADISMGTATDKDLKLLDEQIAAQNEALDEFNKLAANVQQIIAGLQRKLDAAEDELKHLLSMREEVITEFLMGQAELLGKEYVSLAMQLIDKFKQLFALDEIMGSPSRLVGNGNHGDYVLSIPAFSRLKACNGLERNGFYGRIYAAEVVSGPFKDNSVIQKAAAEMKANFSAAGINL